jgi:hypothetical protein
MTGYDFWSDSTHTAAVKWRRLHPRVGRGMMIMRLKTERQPGVDVRKKHPNSALSPRRPPHRGCRQSAGSSVTRFPAPMTLLTETQRASGPRPPESRTPPVASPLPPPPQAAKGRHPAQRLRFVRALAGSCFHCRAQRRANQAIPPRHFNGAVLIQDGIRSADRLHNKESKYFNGAGAIATSKSTHYDTTNWIGIQRFI